MGLREYAAQLAQNAPQAQETQEPIKDTPAHEKPQHEAIQAAQEARTLEVYRRQQEAIKQTEQIQADIAKGIRNGESMTTLFLLAVKGLSLATGNSVLYTQAAADVKAIYGRGLHDPGAREIEAAEIKERLQKLETAERAATDSGDRERIGAAIKRHRELLQELAGNE